MPKYERDNLGFIELDKMGINPSDIFFLDGKKYFFKVDTVGAYRELVIDEFARDLGIRCAE